MAELSGGQRAAARAFKAARGRKGMTQQSAADAAGVDRMVVVRFEGGKTWPDARTQAKLEPIVAMPGGTLEDIAARYSDDADLIDEEIDLTEELTANRQRQGERRREHRRTEDRYATLTNRQAKALLWRQEMVREAHRRRFVLLRAAVLEGRHQDALTLVDELEDLLDTDNDNDLK